MLPRVKRVLFVTSELYPLVKTGGLADVSASLPRALSGLGLDIRILLPGYPAAMTTARQLGSKKLATLTTGGHAMTLWQTRLPDSDVPLWLLDSPALFDRHGGPYQNPLGQDWPDNAQRFHQFALAACQLALGQGSLNWQPDLVHCNDWQTALIPALLHGHRARPATLFTIHNLAYQGVFDASTFWQLGLPPPLWHMDGLEFYGQLAFIKGGIMFADQLSTVSPRYSEEIQQPQFGWGLDGALRHRHDRLHGILNGIDDEIWNPATDPHLAAHYHRDDLSGKAVCKQDLQRQLGLPVRAEIPLLAFVGRLVEQKGVDLIDAVLPGLKDLGCQVALLGSGQPQLERILLEWQHRHPSQISVTLGYDEPLAHQLTAGADMLLMPSRFEPCGLNQLYALKYGTPPIVHGVGGLRDTVFDPTQYTARKANGFSFEPATGEAFWQALERALTLYRQPRHWLRLQRRGMAADASWRRSASDYTRLYRKALAACHQASRQTTLA
ncbi:MAG: glycogen synthase GlgA [Marinobacter sp.]|nr:glycogen synthase GlgA [Marinobacter sp.]